MRYIQLGLGLALLVSAAGCPDGRINLLRPNSPANPLPANTPTKEELVTYLNDNSGNIPAVTSDDVTLTVYLAGGVGVPLSGALRAEGPRNFRMKARFINNEEVDLGSNKDEFWYWIKRADPPAQVFCSYQALEEGRVKQMPFPFQPDWVLEAMGMGKYGPADKYTLDTSDKETLRLVEKTKSPQGVPVRKIIVFNRRKAERDQPQVTDYLLVDDASGKLICSAKIKRRQVITGRGEIPKEMELNWPEAKVKLGLTIDRAQVAKEIPPGVFVRTPLRDVPSYDLANASWVQPTLRAGGPGNMVGPR
jgi:hypothetical protein